MTPLRLFPCLLPILMVLVMSALIVTPALIVVRIIKKTEVLHTKYYGLVTNLLVTDIAQVFCKFVSEYLVMITYLLGLNTDTVGEVLFWLTVPTPTMLFIVTSLLFCNLACGCYWLPLLSQKHHDHQGSTRYGCIHLGGVGHCCSNCGCFITLFYAVAIWDYFYW